MLSIRRQIGTISDPTHAQTEQTVTNWLRMLSIRYQIDFVCWVYGYKLTAYAEHTCTSWPRMLSICIQINSVCSAYAYNLYVGTQRSKIHFQSVNIWEMQSILSISTKFTGNHAVLVFYTLRKFRLCSYHTFWNNTFLSIFENQWYFFAKI